MLHSPSLPWMIILRDCQSTSLVIWQTQPPSLRLPGLRTADSPQGLLLWVSFTVVLLPPLPLHWSPKCFSCLHISLLPCILCEHAKVLFLIHAFSLVLPLVTKALVHQAEALSVLEKTKQTNKTKLLGLALPLMPASLFPSHPHLTIHLCPVSSDLSAIILIPCPTMSLFGKSHFSFSAQVNCY